ncbi:MAG: UDP-N-acetylmuramoyl-L-alanyl-D-glutamate--2,6-diaminopimelate ligase [Bacteroidetes bacterium]|nr:UDP-N-acetylmuramoyl-L-alanyl-D-glutamate--2,6-diaminopimelate ligase [Bacteroidota bacterium]
MKQLKEILYKAGLLEVIGTTSTEVENIVFNSNEVQKGCLFVAVRGTRVDGHSFILKAVEDGATAIVCEEFPKTIRQGVTYARVTDSAIALSVIAANFYDNPSEKLKLIGITGTNGKTTTATLLFHLFRRLGFRCGLLSTVQNQINEEVIAATHTTPDPIKLNSLLSLMLRENCEYCFMEVSSHAVAQHRIAGLTFKGGLFTNISHDHLDYHKTFDEYIRAKKGFFDQLGEDAFALYNADDKNGKIMIQNCKGVKKSFALKSMADFRCKVMENSLTGLMLNIEGNEVLCKLIGSFNAYNIIGVYAVAVMLGEEKLDILTGISSLEPVEGRFEYIISGNQVVGIIDYAHTPDALQNVLNTIRDIRTGNEKVITVVGCGGDRDAAKRPIMAKIACEMSDKVIFTSDNPRSENPDTIIDEMKAGVPAHHVRKTLSVSDRKEALKAACSMAAPGDIILVAGKGHEKYQEIKGVKHPFDDRQVLEDSFRIFES